MCCSSAIMHGTPYTTPEQMPMFSRYSSMSMTLRQHRSTMFQHSIH
ncbi:hypothetical protein BIFGAL_02540 [Bifidobacterium gallicum DSM 20093 = LMG 11596]|uniref:Uncharacterized protein n=1 Tax=Bifidobacterium gallicum DSM 20093 = LMG 11596 TaxID=561180 RepID=D1NRY9_9BIFI|nr:hypothetical protein BIFGAL_02540 [Bifidobacterium gallicum DSM 20093 = LMG 11596]